MKIALKIASITRETSKAVKVSFDIPEHLKADFSFKAGQYITIKKEKTGPLPQNVKYSIIPARNNAPLSDVEKELELFDLSKIYKRQSYDEQKEWLLQNTAYFAGDVSDEFKPAEDVDDLA